MKNPYDRVLESRHKNRPTAQDYIDNLFSDFIEFHGDRRYGDDGAIISGIGLLKNMPVTVIAQAKGKSPKERGMRNSGSPHPEGYRKALRLMKQAEKFSRPVICIVDTSGAYPGIEAEKRGQAQAIAENLMEMSVLKTPIVSIFIGEGGSGGALALAVCDLLIMLENSFYSVISPEGCASILWKNSKLKKEAADSLKLTSYDLKKAGVAECIVREPGDYKMFKKVFNELEDYLYKKISDLNKKPVDILISDRYEKFRRF